jgi:hypothetical protein
VWRARMACAGHARMSGSLTSPLYMRRVFVICLILLLPLNMFALAMAASAMLPPEPSQRVTTSEPLVQLASAPVFADAYLPDNYDCQSSCDIDPDEPPAGADVHDAVNEELSLRLADVRGGVSAPPSLSHPSQFRHPLFKPPRAV